MSRKNGVAGPMRPSAVQKLSAHPDGSNGEPNVNRLPRRSNDFW